jgi:sodium transport system permease protein
MIVRKVSRLRAWWTILRKEVLDNLRDRRTLSTIAMSVVIGPLLMFGFLWFAEKTVKEETDLVNAEAMVLPVVGAHYAPNLMAWLAQNNINVVEPPADPEASIRKGEHRAILVLTEQFPDSFSKAKTAPIRLIHDSSISGLEQIGFHTAKNAINAYSRQVGAMRLSTRGINPEIVRAINVNVSDVATPQARSGQILSIMPYLIIMFIMAGGMYLAIDSTAGEREKGSLEPLLTQPVERNIILLAKLSATIVFSSLTFLLVLLGLALGFAYMPIDSISVSVSAIKVIKVFLFCLPFSFLGCALMVLLASFTKSYKEAQSYLSMVMLLPSLPLMLLAFLSPEPSINNMWIPSLSQGLIIIETFKGEDIPLHLIAISMLASTAFAMVLAWLAIKLYQRERILG